jgi:hypothetical protein
MTKTVRAALALSLVLAVGWLSGCDSVDRPELGGPCAQTCDCAPTDTAPLRCPGEWVCNPERTCEYVCKTPCATLPYTCAADESCDGNICSERTNC